MCEVGGRNASQTAFGIVQEEDVRSIAENRKRANMDGASRGKDR